jgi:hypothetical protein
MLQQTVLLFNTEKVHSRQRWQVIRLASNLIIKSKMAVLWVVAPFSLV